MNKDYLNYNFENCPFCDVKPTVIVRESIMEHEVLCPLCQIGAKAGIDEVVYDKGLLSRRWFEVIKEPYLLKCEGRCLQCGFWKGEEGGLGCEHCIIEEETIKKEEEYHECQF